MTGGAQRCLQFMRINDTRPILIHRHEPGLKNGHLGGRRLTVLDNKPLGGRMHRHLSLREGGWNPRGGEQWKGPSPPISFIPDTVKHVSPNPLPTPVITHPPHPSIPIPRLTARHILHTPPLGGRNELFPSLLHFFLTSALNRLSSTSSVTHHSP